MSKANKLFNKYLENSGDAVVLEFQDAVVCSSNMDILKAVVMSEKKRNKNFLVARLYNRPAKYKIQDVEMSIFYTACVYDSRYNCATKVDYSAWLDCGNLNGRRESSVFVCATSPERLKQIAKPVFDVIDRFNENGHIGSDEDSSSLNGASRVEAVVGNIETPMPRKYETGIMLSNTSDAFEFLIDAYTDANSELER